MQLPPSPSLAAQLHLVQTEHSRIQRRISRLQRITHTAGDNTQTSTPNNTTTRIITTTTKRLRIELKDGSGRTHRTANSDPHPHTSADTQQEQREPETLKTLTTTDSITSDADATTATTAATPPAVVSPSSRVDVRARNRRMFAGLLSHLASAHSSFNQETHSHKHQQQQDIEQKISTKMQETRSALQSTQQAERQQALELCRQIEPLLHKKQQYLYQQWLHSKQEQLHQQQQQTFHWTCDNTQQTYSIAFVPKQQNPSLRERLKERKRKHEQEKSSGGRGHEEEQRENDDGMKSSSSTITVDSDDVVESQSEERWTPAEETQLQTLLENEGILLKGESDSLHRLPSGRLAANSAARRDGEWQRDLFAQDIDRENNHRTEEELERPSHKRSRSEHTEGEVEEEEEGQLHTTTSDDRDFLPESRTTDEDNV